MTIYLEHNYYYILSGNLTMSSLPYCRCIFYFVLPSEWVGSLPSQTLTVSLLPSSLCRTLLEQVDHWQSFLALVNMIMFCTGIPGHYPVNETTSSLTLTFWYTLQVRKVKICSYPIFLLLNKCDSLPEQMSVS